MEAPSANLQAPGKHQTSKRIGEHRTLNTQHRTSNERPSVGMNAAGFPSSLLLRRSSQGREWGPCGNGPYRPLLAIDAARKSLPENLRNIKHRTLNIEHRMRGGLDASTEISFVAGRRTKVNEQRDAAVTRRPEARATRVTQERRAGSTMCAAGLFSAKSLSCLCHERFC